MDQPSEHPANPNPRRQEADYDDPHFHDDADFEPPDDGDHPRTRPPARRKPVRRPPPRRPHYED